MRAFFAEASFVAEDCSAADALAEDLFDADSDLFDAAAFPDDAAFFDGAAFADGVVFAD
ncbi:MAG: hypothetical protein ACXIVD_09575 [Salinarimonas sp.]